MSAIDKLDARQTVFNAPPSRDDSAGMLEAAVGGTALGVQFTAVFGVSPMINQRLLAMLVCPETRAPLKMAEPQLVAKLNAAIAARTLTNRAGKLVERPFDAGLVRDDGAVFYGVIDEIPVLLIEDAIPLDPNDESRPR